MTNEAKKFNNALKAEVAKGVTEITTEYFDKFDYKNIDEVIIPDGITVINDWAFCGWEGLTSVIIPDGVYAIGDYAFKGCNKLEALVIPDSVTIVGDYAFPKNMVVIACTTNDDGQHIYNILGQVA